MARNRNGSYLDNRGLIPILKKRDISGSPNAGSHGHTDSNMALVEKKRESALPSVVSTNKNNLSVYQTRQANKRAWADVAPMKIGRSVRIASSPESNSELPQAH